MVDIKQELKDSINFLNNQIFLLKELGAKKFKGRTEDIKILIRSSCSTGSALLILGEYPDYFYTEALMLSRSFLEKLINICYLEICSDIEFENFFLHPRYKSYHNLRKEKFTRNSKLKIEFSGLEKIKKHPTIAKALTRFSENNIKMDRSKLSLDKKISKITEHYNIDGWLLLNNIFIYSNASESLHGSLYGCLYHTGIFDPTINHQNKHEMSSNMYKNLIILFSGLGGLIHCTFSILNKKNNIEDILGKSSFNQEKNKVTLDNVFKKKI